MGKYSLAVYLRQFCGKKRLVKLIRTEADAVHTAVYFYMRSQFFAVRYVLCAKLCKLTAEYGADDIVFNNLRRIFRVDVAEYEYVGMNAVFIKKRAQLKRLVRAGNGKDAAAAFVKYAGTFYAVTVAVSFNDADLIHAGVFFYYFVIVFERRL